MQKTYFGIRTVDKLKEILQEHKPKSIFLVTGKQSYETCGAKEKIDEILYGYNFFRFYDFATNPKLDDVEKGIGLCRENKCDFVIAIGGGSVIDMAKLINAFANSDGETIDYIINYTAKKKELGKRNVLVAIPTTTGTGSESTHFAVVYVNKEKYSLENVLPDYAIVDPQFSMNLPPRITADSGADVLAHAIESYWCIYSNNESRGYAREAITIAMENLEKAVTNPNEASRVAMARAANLAGKAINISKTTASHAISYPITSYFNVPHGHAAMLTIPSMIVYNSGVMDNDVLDKRGVEYVKRTMHELVKLVGAKNPEEAKNKLTELLKRIGLETKVHELGINSEGDMETIIKSGFNPGRVKNNPRMLTAYALQEMLEKIR